MATNPLAGKPAPASLFMDVSKLEANYYNLKPDVTDANQLVSFGTSGHRGTPFNGTFTEAHILATTQAICEYRKGKGISGPLYIGKDSHGASNAAQRTAVEVLAANGVETFIQQNDGVTPTPSISHAILTYNRGRKDGLADGIVITPSHNPPEDGGFKYNSPNGGPADTDITGWVQNRANEILKDGNRAVTRLSYESALKASNTHPYDFITPYVNTLGEVIDMGAIKAAGVRIGIDPLGGASLPYWEPVKQRYGLDITLVNTKVDARFSFMTVDHDGKIRMDCSSPYAMANLIALKDRFDVAFGNDADNDRHGIVTRTAGLMNPNHYLAVSIAYLFTHRPGWNSDAGIGKTLVSSSLIDRVARKLERKLVEVPVGFKWFVSGLLSSSLGFGGEESAGASFLRQDGSVWSTDKDGIIMDLLAAEMMARTGKDPAQLYRDLTDELGEPVYERIDAVATPEQKAILSKLSPDQVKATELAGDKIIAMMTTAPGNGAAIGGLKVVTEQGWFAARPSGTEDVYKLYAESFRGKDHLKRIQDEAQALITTALTSAQKG